MARLGDDGKLEGAAERCARVRCERAMILLIARLHLIAHACGCVSFAL